MTQERDASKETQPTPEAEEPKTPSPQEETDALRQKLQEAETKAAQLEKEGKAHQQAALKASRDVQELRTQLTDREADREMQKLLIAELAERRGVTDDEESEELKRRKPDLLSKLTAIEQRQAIKRARETGLRYKKIAEEELGLKPSDEEYLILHALVNANQLEFVDRRIESLRAKKQPTEAPKEEPKETEEERIARLAEEKARKILDEKGYTKQEKGLPSAASKAFAKIEQDYADGLIPTAEYEKAIKERGRR